ncbi:MAG: hypothetical protein GX677_00595 [Treponema sp.]|nr:hypothetical protein [Treponema sp.]
MKKYELMAIYPLDDEKSKKGAEDLKSTLANFSAEIEKYFKINMNLLKHQFVKIEEK